MPEKKKGRTELEVIHAALKRVCTSDTIEENGFGVGSEKRTVLSITHRAGECVAGDGVEFVFQAHTGRLTSLEFFE